MRRTQNMINWWIDGTKRRNRPRLYCFFPCDSQLMLVANIRSSKEIWGQLASLYESRKMSYKIMPREQLLSLKMQEESRIPEEKWSENYAQSSIRKSTYNFQS
eukprot:c27909_g1_i1 orf=547-855(+)